VTRSLAEGDVFPWAEAQLGGKISASVHQGGRESGGRPGWFITVEQETGPLRAYIRGDRGGDFGFNRIYSLQREARLLKLLREEGIPVPEVLAASTSPSALILSFIEGTNDFTLIESAAERDRITRHLAEIMARWHAIPAAKFAEIGFDLPRAPAERIGPPRGLFRFRQRPFRNVSVRFRAVGVEDAALWPGNQAGLARVMRGSCAGGVSVAAPTAESGSRATYGSSTGNARTSGSRSGSGRGGLGGGARVARPREFRMARAAQGEWIAEITRRRPWQRGHSRTSIAKTRRSRSDHPRRRVRKADADDGGEFVRPSLRAGSERRVLDSATLRRARDGVED
jgi:hypothetical protein